MTTAIDSISKKAEVFAKAHALLGEKVTALHDGLSALRRDHLPEIRRAVTRATEAQDALHALIALHPECFTKPKTRIFAGVKVGYGKGKGKITFDDADAVVARIKKHFPEQADVLVSQKEVPVKDALAQLSATDLKKLGVTVSQAGEKTIVKPVDSDVDKLVDALLKGAEQESEAE